MRKGIIEIINGFIDHTSGIGMVEFTYSEAGKPTLNEKKQFQINYQVTSAEDIEGILFSQAMSHFKNKFTLVV